MRWSPDEIFRYIIEADNVLSNVIHRTPLNYSYTFSKLSGGNVYLKLENLQKVGSFKVRGAYYKIWREYLKSISHVVTASSGNHAQGVAYSARQLGIKATIVMPRYTPLYKISATKSYGAEVILYGETYDDAYHKAIEIASSKSAPFIHPFEDPHVIAGQGTIGLELLRELDNIDRVIVPVGGGGLISGIAIALKKISSNIKIIGVQPKGANALYLSYHENRLVKIDKVSTIADGVAVKEPGENTFRLVRDLVDDMITVSEEEIARAVFLLLERAKLVVEPAGALGIAAILGGEVDVSRGNTVVILSGGNIDMMLLSELIIRGLTIENRHIRMRGMLPDKPGQLKKIIDIIASKNLNIINIEHERGNPLVTPGYAIVTLEIEVSSPDDVKYILNKIKEKGVDFKVI